MQLCYLNHCIIPDMVVFHADIVLKVMNHKPFNFRILLHSIIVSYNAIHAIQWYIHDLYWYELHRY